jgi:hypothetical protein
VISEACHGRESNVTDRKRIQELFIALSDATMRDQHAHSLVEDVTGLWRKMCCKEDTETSMLNAHTRRLQVEILKRGYDVYSKDTRH